MHLIEAHDLTIKNGSRVLFDGLNLALGQERAALVGRNGVGKSTLLRALAESSQVVRHTQPYLVPQLLPPAQASGGESRRRALEAARQAQPALLLLDEPTQDLDQPGIEWLRGWLADYPGGLLVASHEPELLSDFSHFFLVSEAGCELYSGPFEGMLEQLEARHRASQERYLRQLRQLESQEERSLYLARRRARKKQYGRARELDRATPKATLNTKRDQAQDNHARSKRVREARLAAIRQQTRAARRSLRVDLPLVLPPPAQFEDPAPVIRLDTPQLALRLAHDRVAVTGPNGSGKTTLLELMAQSADSSRVGVVAQGGSNWMREECLLDQLGAESLAAHQFPLALARRPLRSLSPGERARAALIWLYHSSVSMLILDEPSYSLDLLGQRALAQALQAWPGGLVVASHDRTLLAAVDFDWELALS
ncbi:MAG: hypothetical protein AB7S38_12945 [Vulcanimicrobiota bacterium]